MTAAVAPKSTEPTGGDIRPMVGRDAGNRPLWIGIGLILALGIVLFAALNARRQTLTAPAVRPRAADLAQVPSMRAPPLYIPPESVAVAPPPPLPLREPPLPPAMPAPSPRPSRPPPVAAMPTAPPPMVDPYQPPVTEAPRPSGPAIVYDGGEVPRSTETTTGGTTSSTGGANTSTAPGRARAGRLANRATTVPQGTLIAAVLETALDSTQPGQLRAMVSRDVVNVIGNRVLIPRGSRLFGSYRGELASGQKRVQVEWTRLVRPDGVTIDLGSPATDSLGRAGLGGQVNTYFLERLGGALLQSTVNFGGLAASRAVSDGSVVVAVPGAAGEAASSLVGPTPKPTLRVKQGTRIAVLVARDLDFTGVEGRAP